MERKEDASRSEGVTQKVLLGIGAAAVVFVIGLVIYFARASDPAARGPIPYKQFDYGQHMKEQERQLNRQPGAVPGSTR